MKSFKIVVFVCFLAVLMIAFTGCTGSKTLPNQLYDYFSTGDFTANYWVRGGDVLPYMQSETVYKGKYAVEFSNLQDDETSLMYIDVNIEEDAVIRFYVNSSIESDRGVLRFFIDDTLSGEWSAQNKWKRVIRELPAGEHRLRWEFENFNDENDKVWLDDIMISHLIPLGEKIEFADDEFKQLVLSRIGKNGGEAVFFDLIRNEYFKDSPVEHKLIESMTLLENTKHQINKNVRYSNEEVYMNEVTDIEFLDIGWLFDSIMDITGIEHFSNLVYLEIMGPNLDNITPLSELKNIQQFYLFHSNIQDITPLNTSAENGSLETLEILNKTSINDQLTSESIQALGTWASLKELIFYSVDITNADFLSNLINLETLILDDIPITDISPLSDLLELIHLDITDTPIENINPLGFLTGLKDLILETLPITDISPLESLSGLENLELRELSIEDVSPLRSLPGLKDLILETLPITDISFLESLTGLESLELRELSIDSLDDLGSLISLEDLRLDELDIFDISPLEQLLGLTHLDLDNIEITDINALEPLTNLKYLFVSHTKIKDLNAVRNLTNIIWLNLQDNLIEDISPIAESLINSLKILSIRRNQLDLSPGSEDMKNIQTLIDAGIIVHY